MRERDIFIEALQWETPAERAAYLHDACAADTDLRQRIERLLLEHENQKSFILDRAPAAVVAVADAAGEATADDRFVSLDPPTFLTPPGTVIGRYKLLEPIGEGGYGTVFMAEQTSPVHRKVALKIIKAGMDTKQVIARFEAERQALALMDHPNIAKVFDAGVTDEGRPYFVMELVKGTPITKYCDEHKLSPRARLELFVSVCHAVQHAHQKGIIHRDLKPTNVLVAQYDGKPVPKVIDFGVAKATGQQLTERTMFTGFGDVIGTPQYMSPEQAELNQLDVDTRSDIYSLGVLLYELLTGTTPLEGKRVREAALLEVLRVIREEEPPRPSTRLTMTAELPSIAAQRGLDPRKLSGLVHGELDWIVMRALEKDRTRRYETANGLASDVQRYLQDEAVHACPPSAGYRFRKFARRNRAALLIATAAVAALLVLVMGLAVSNRMIAAERDEKTLALAEKEQALAVAEASRQLADYMNAVHYHRLAAGTREIDELYHRVSGLLNGAASAPSSSSRHGRDTIRERIGGRQRDLAFRLHSAGRLEYAEETFRSSIVTFEKLRADDPDVAQYWHYLADSHRQLGHIELQRNDLAGAEREFRLAVEIHDQRVARLPGQHVAGDLDWARAYFDLSRLLIKSGRQNEAGPLIARGVEAAELTNRGQQNKSLTQIQLSGLLLDAGDVDQAIRTCSAVIASQPQMPEAWISRGNCYATTGEFQKSAEDFSVAIKLRPDLGEAWTGRAWAFFHLRRWDSAVADYSEALIRSPNVHTNWFSRGCAYVNLAQWDKALVDFSQAIHGWPEDRSSWYRRGLTYAQLNQPDKAVADIRQAIARGYRVVEELKNEPLLDSLRDRDDFKQLLIDLEGKKD